MSISVQLRELASLLTDKTSIQVLNDVKSKLLSIADELEKHTTHQYQDIDIDNILNEIDEKENETKMGLSEEEYNILHQGIENTFSTYIAYFPTIDNNFEDKLSKKTWLLIFREPTEEQLQAWELKNKINDPPFDMFNIFNLETETETETEEKNVVVYDGPPPPFAVECKDMTVNDLMRVFDEIPKQLKDENRNGFIHSSKYSELAKWILKYKTDNDSNDKNKVFQAIIHDAYFNRFINVVKYKSVTDAAAFYSKYGRNINLTRQEICTGDTILHIALCNRSSAVAMVDWVLSLKGIDVSIKNYENETALDRAKEEGKWVIVDKLTFASMGSKMRQKNNEQIAKLNRSKGIVNQWFRFYAINDHNSDEYKSMVKMVESMKTLIKKRLPISDDLLLLCFSFEMKQNENNPLQCSLWKCLYNTLNEILRIPLNRRNWLWFKKYVFESCLWYQKIPNDTDDKLLYHLLITMVSKQLKAQRDYLAPYIDKLENKTNEDWEALKNYKEFIVTNNIDGLRQDECIESSTNRELLPFPIRPTFTNDQLRKLNERVTEFNCHHQYDVNGYLSKLSLTAHSLNKTFHDAMRIIYKINKETSENVNDGVTYHEGPVKRLLRAQAKAETDYAQCSFPTTAKICDFIRCCLVYKNPKDLLNGMKKIFQAAEEGTKNEKMMPLCFYQQCGNIMKTCQVHTVHKKGFDCMVHCYQCNKWFNKNNQLNELIYHCGGHIDIQGSLCLCTCLCIKCGNEQLAKKRCIKKILRVKNLFLENKRENKHMENLCKYSDIKMGVLIEYGDQSMIVEVQFLLDFYLKAKSLGHGLYEIQRNEDFILSVNKIINISNQNDGIDKLLRKAISSGDEQLLATLILNEAPINLMKKLDENKDGLIHIACRHGHKKVLKFMLDTVQANETVEKFKEFINLKGHYGRSPIQICQDEEFPNLLKLLLSYSKIDINSKDNGGQTVLFAATKVGDTTAKTAQILNILINDKRCEWNTTNGKMTLFHAACKGCENIEFVKRLWAKGYFKINDVTGNKYGGSKKTALMFACENHANDEKGNEELVLFLLSIKDIDINLVDSYGDTAIDIALQFGFQKIMSLLYNQKDLNWKSGKRNKFACACDRDIEMVKFVLELWPDININGVDNNKGGQAWDVAIHRACRSSIAVLEFVLQLPDIKPDLCDSDEYSAWLRTIEDGFSAIEKLKILFNRNDIDFNRKVNDKNALDMAIEMGDEKLIKWLKSNGFTQMK